MCDKRDKRKVSTIQICCKERRGSQQYAAPVLITKPEISARVWVYGEQRRVWHMTCLHFDVSCIQAIYTRLRAALCIANTGSPHSYLIQCPNPECAPFPMQIYR